MACVHHHYSQYDDWRQAPDENPARRKTGRGGTRPRMDVALDAYGHQAFGPQTYSFSPARGRTAAAQEQRSSSRSERTSWAIAGLALCSAAMVGVQAWAMFTAGTIASPQDTVTGSVRPEAPARQVAAIAHAVNAPAKADRLSPEAAAPSGETWRYLLGEAAVPRPGTVPLPPTRPFADAAGRGDAPAFISQRLASLTPGVSSDVESVLSGKTDLVGFDNSAFPYRGVNPRSQSGGFAGGRYRDNSVLMHVPKGFDARKPGVIVVYFHGHGATLARDVRDRQLLPQQISDSGVNAVLLAPQLAVDAADSSAGKFWERGGLKRFLDEAAVKLADLSGNPGAKAAFERMPVVIVAYSGGFVSAAWSLHVGGASNRVRGVVLMDALYGEMDKFSSWILDHRSAFFVSAYTRYTKHNDDAFSRQLEARGIKVVEDLKGPLQPGTVAFLGTSGLTHRDFVTRAWTSYPIRDVLVRMAQR